MGGGEGLGFWRDHMRGVGVQKIPFKGGVIRYYVLHSLRGGGSGKLYHNTNKIPPPPPRFPQALHNDQSHAKI